MSAPSALSALQRVLLPALLLAAALSCGPAGEESPAPSASRPNIVVIVIDTLRADHLPFYGYGVDTAPFLGGLADRSVLFDRAYSTSSWTAPATASIFTGVYPRQHGVVTGRAVTYQMSKQLDTTLTLSRIPAELETLPEAMKRAGYRTYGISDNFNVCPQMGFADGFDVFSSDARQYLGAAHVNKVVKGWHSTLSSGSPYFLYIHYMDPHLPYRIQRPWYRHPAATPAGERPEHLRQADRAEQVARYDSEINLVDASIAELFRLYGWGENTLLVITSDHGEEFWDHGGVHHDKTLYDEVLRVPLMVHDTTAADALKPRRIDESVSLIDLLPTLAELAGLPADGRRAGASLVPMMKGAQASSAHGRNLFAHLERHFFKPWGAHDTLRGKDGREHYVALASMRDGWKLVVDTRENSLLFDRSRDPLEKMNLHADQAETAAGLEANLKAFTKEMAVFTSESFQEKLSSEEIERLRSLGYVQ